MLLHAVVTLVERHIGHVQEAILKTLFHHITLESAADHKLIDAVNIEDLEDVPWNLPPANLHHRLRIDLGFLADAGDETARQITAFTSNRLGT